MASELNRDQSSGNRARVRDVLMREWDPIGVAGIPEATDEYDRYVDEVYVILMNQRVDADAIAAHLFDTAVNYMGLPAHEDLAERSGRAAAALVALRPEFGPH
jgi:hypothetical protein